MKEYQTPTAEIVMLRIDEGITVNPEVTEGVGSTIFG